jgi:hypothetical protein
MVALLISHLLGGQYTVELAVAGDIGELDPGEEPSVLAVEQEHAGLAALRITVGPAVTGEAIPPNLSQSDQQV